MADSKSFVERIRHLVSRQRGITEKKMFGGVYAVTCRNGTLD